MIKSFLEIKISLIEIFKKYILLLNMKYCTLDIENRMQCESDIIENSHCIRYPTYDIRYSVGK